MVSKDDQQDQLLPDEEYEYEEDDEDTEDDVENATQVEHTEKEYEYKAEPPQEGIYGMAVASLITDYRMFLLSMSGQKKARYGCRLFLALVCTGCTITLQCYLTMMTKIIVTPPAVRGLREAYSDFQVYLYDGHTYELSTGHQRGIAEFRNYSKPLDGMKQEEMEALCESPLAQPLFLAAILLVWTVTCLAYFRESMSFTTRMMSLKHTKSMKSKFVLEDEKNDKGNDTGVHTVVRVTVGVKIAILLIVQIPVLSMNLFLLWIGCRWLVATLGFGELLLNAIALEFVLNLHKIIYSAIVPYTMKLSLGNIQVPHSGTRTEMPNWWNMLSAFGLIIIATFWVIGYMFVFQHVLPDYQWDIAAPCQRYMAQAAFIIW